MHLCSTKVSDKVATKFDNVFGLGPPRYAKNLPVIYVS